MAENNDKGQLLENVVARLHQVQGVDVQSRVELPTLSGNGEPREIDVLLTSSAGPYKVRIAIECKNWAKKIGPGDIGDFKDKLDDVGLNVRGAIYIAVGGFSLGAKRRAAELGIETMLLSGFTPDRLRIAVDAAFAGTLFLIPVVSKVSFETDLDSASPMLHAEDGQVGGTILDLVWKAWMLDVPAKLGEASFSEPVPPGWGSLEGGKFAAIDNFRFTVSVEGRLLSRGGSVQQIFLTNVSTGHVVLGSVGAIFDPLGGVYNLECFVSEDDIREKFDREHATVKVLERVKVPRVQGGGRFGPFMWLPDDTNVKGLWEKYKADPQVFHSDDVQHEMHMPTDLMDLFELPSQMYVNGLRSRLGRSWPEHLWTVVTPLSSV